MDSPELPSPVACGGDGEEDEMKKVALMRAVVEAEDPAAKAEDDHMLRRFLHARDLDIEKGSSLFLKYLKWRRLAVPNGFISESEIHNELAQKKVFMQGFDKQQRPIVVILAAKHYYYKRDLGEFKRLVVYMLDKLCSGMPSGQEKFFGIVDLKGWGYSNCDIPSEVVVSVGAATFPSIVCNHEVNLSSPIFQITKGKDGLDVLEKQGH